MAGVNVENLKSAQFEVAKFWLMLSTICSVGVLVTGIAVLFVDQWSVLLALAAGVFGGLNVFFAWQSDNMKEIAESMLRRYEMNNSLGWGISRREINNMLVLAPKSVIAAAESPDEKEYFASTSGIGLERLVDNLEEDAWWSKHLANEMAKWVGLLSVLVTVLAFVLLIVAFQSSVAQTAADRIAQVIISIVVFMFSGGYVRLAFDYRDFALKSREVEMQAEQLRRSPRMDETEAIKLQQDYQIARSIAPLLPTWNYKRMQGRLNGLWPQRNSTL